MPLELTRDVTMKECLWLDRDFRKGEKLERYTGPTYGVIGDGVACRVPGREIFFEFPRDALKTTEAYR